MDFERLFKKYPTGFFGGKKVKISLDDGSVHIGYGAGYEDEFDNDIADGICLEQSENEEDWGNGILIPFDSITNVELLD